MTKSKNKSILQKGLTLRPKFDLEQLSMIGTQPVMEGPSKLNLYKRLKIGHLINIPYRRLTTT